MADAVMILNAGSSSIKFALFETSGARVSNGEIERIGDAPHFIAFDAGGQPLIDRQWTNGAALSHEDLLATLLEWVDAHLLSHRGNSQPVVATTGDDPRHENQQSASRFQPRINPTENSITTPQRDCLVGVGHRIVHGGADFVAPLRLTPEIMTALDGLTPLAPLHQPHNIAAIRAISALRPELPQIGCFDTGFHHDMPEIATRLPLPTRYHDAGIRRYGFHGLSYEFIAQRLASLDPEAAAGRVIAAHMGNGASACAMRAGQSVDTSMGFTALDGFMMGTRTGALDPGVVLYMMEHEKLTPSEIGHILYNESGLIGVSGESSDMRILLASRHPAAALAIDLFCRRAAREIAGLTTSLGGLDALVFTAGIGEHVAPIRHKICQRLAHLNIDIDRSSNQQNGPVISSKTSAVKVWVMTTDEEAVIARHTVAMLND